MNGIRSTTPRSEERQGSRQPSEFTVLAKMIRDRGLLRRRYGYYWSKLIGLPLVLAGALVAFVWIGDTWWQLFTAVFLAVVFTQIAFLGHDSAHRQIFVSRKWNDWVSLVLGDLLVGMSYGWWQHKHTRHHANPNKLGSDPDIELPVIVVASERAAPRGRILSWLRSHQGVFFFPILLREGVSLHASGVRRVVMRGPLHRRGVEIGFLLVRLVGFAVLVFLVLSPGIAFVFLAVQLGLFGFYMAMMSRNVRGGRLLDIAMGGLNYQIEHHLFPSMPRPHLRKAAPIIADYCRNHGVPYVQTGLLASYAIIVRYINRVGLGERDVFTCPLVEQRRHITATPQ